MKRHPNILVVIPVFFILLIIVTSCHKTSADIITSQPVYTQNIYTIDSTASPTPGTILATPYDDSITVFTGPTTGMVLLMNQSGTILNEQTTPGDAFCLNKWVINGNTQYTYLVNDPTAIRMLGLDPPAGYAVITDSNLNEIKRVNFTPYGTGVFPSGQGLDIHDFILLSDDDYITLAFAYKYVSNIPADLNPAYSEPVLTPIIEEINNGNVVWNWDGSDDTTFYRSSVQNNDFSDSTTCQDYIHMNSLYIDPTDNNLICSMRNQDQIIKINRQTGVVMWRLGGYNSDFPLDTNEVFLRQHHATLADSNKTLLVFDDGVEPQRPYSRIVEFQLNETGKTISSFKSFNIPEPFTELTGSVQKIGEDYFIGGGTGNYLLDVNYTTGQKVMEYKSPKSTYRAYKY